MSDSPNSIEDILSHLNGGIRLVVKARPGSSRRREPRIVSLAGDKFALEITVSDAPEDGKANKAILASLAEGLGINKSDLSIKSGAAAKIKLIDASGDPAVLKRRLALWLNLLPL